MGTLLLKQQMSDGIIHGTGLILRPWCELLHTQPTGKAQFRSLWTRTAPQPVTRVEAGGLFKWKGPCTESTGIWSWSWVWVMWRIQRGGSHWGCSMPLNSSSHASCAAAHSLISSAAVKDLTPASPYIPALHQVIKTSEVFNIIIS